MRETRAWGRILQLAALGILAAAVACGAPRVPVPKSSPEIQKVLSQLERLGAKVILDKAGNPQEVILARTGVRDDDLALLARLPDVQIVSLAYTAVTDAGLAHLKECRGLRQLILYKSGVTDSGVDALKKQLPGCKVTY